MSPKTPENVIIYNNIMINNKVNYSQSILTSRPSSAGLNIKSNNPFTAHPLPTLESSEFHLRSIRAEDLSTWFNYLTLPQVMEHSSWQLKSPEDLQQFIQIQDWSQAQAQIKFAIVNSQDQLAGTIGFHTYSNIHLSAEIAYDLSPAFWGQGIISTACHALTKWAHQEIGLVRVQACVLDSNLRSLQVLQRCDFEREGLLRQYKHIRGQARDYWILSHIQSTNN